MASRRTTDVDGQCRHGDALRVAFVNAMPDQALLEAERQFTTLLADAAAQSGTALHVELHALPGVARSAPAREFVARRYRTLDALVAGGRVDAVVVTGSAPRADALDREAFWPHLARLFDWSRQNAGSLLVSCLAAHAAVAHFDGIARRRLPAKCSGLFTVDATGPHPLLEGGGRRRWRTAHSRYNTIDESALRSAGYVTLSRSEAVGVDAFVGERQGLLLLGLHGHPEYAPDTLLREYRRDVAHVLSGASQHYPEIPHAVLDTSSEQRLRSFRARVQSGAATTMDDFPDALATPADVSADMGGGRAMFAAWLRAMSRRRQRVAQVPNLLPALQVRVAGQR